MHTYHTSHILERVAPFQDMASSAAAHHERLDGTGYHRQLSGSQIPLTGRILAVANAYAQLTNQERSEAHRESAQQTIQRGVPSQFDGDCYEALAASLSGSRSTRAVPLPRRQHDTLTEREVEVLDLLARSLSNPRIADALVISRKTIEHHLQHMYAKLSVTCRTAAVAYAVQQRFGRR